MFAKINGGWYSSSMAYDLTRERYKERPDTAVVDAYRWTLDAIETVAQNQERKDITPGDAQELGHSRASLHRDLAYIGMLLIERQIEL